jgi:hypothetical protein
MVICRWVVLVSSLVVMAQPACRRTGSKPSAADATPAATGTVGPLGANCYDTTGAQACPPDPADPSGQRLPAHGGACRLPVCRPCGSETRLSFRDERGNAAAGFCICVPMSDDSGRGVFTCYTTEAWKKRAQ